MAGGKSGPTKGQMRRSRTLAQAIRDGLDPSLLFEFHMATAQRHINVRVNEACDGIEWDESGIPPADELVHRSIQWLSDRGWGLPAQSIHLEADYKHQIAMTGQTLDVGALPAGIIAGVLRLVRGAGDALASSAHVGDRPALPVIDAIAHERQAHERPAQEHPAHASSPALPMPASQHDPRTSDGASTHEDDAP